MLETTLGISHFPTAAVSIKNFSDSFMKTGRLDSEYYQPKFDALFDALKKFSSKRLGGNNGIVSIKKSIEPGSDAYKDEGIPFIRVRDVSKHEITSPEIYLSHDVVENVKALFPKKDTILFSKDGSVGIAYKLEHDEDIITSGALLHLTVKNTSEVLPDYLTLVLNSPVVQMQAERDSNGAIIQHWKPSEIENVIIPVLDMDKQRELAEMVQKSFALRRQSKQLLEYAKQAVEIAIEQGEDASLAWLKDKVEQ
ncbi:restriction endonuclease subunit S [Pseudoflavonifractor capillosus]|nr:restriction endonuclease subunit S [Pseudoflavonifractor capillosus]MBM6977119.1 restriction endonuclease subunit S [Intestinimonas butyriciproducens]